MIITKNLLDDTYNLQLEKEDIESIKNIRNRRPAYKNMSNEEILKKIFEFGKDELDY